MAYDHDFADRVRASLEGTPGFAELAMFGGLGWTLNGNMAVGTLGDVLIVRVGPEAPALMDHPGVDVFDLTGRVMKGWLTVAIDALDDEAELQDWLDRGTRFALSLPPKPGR